MIEKALLFNRNGAGNATSERRTLRTAMRLATKSAPQDRSLIVLRPQGEDDTEAVNEVWTNCRPLRRRCSADFQDCQNSANADFLTILSLDRRIESSTSRRLRACTDL